MTSKAKTADSPRAAVAPGAARLTQDGTIHEVLVTEPNGHQTVHRVAAGSKAEAERIVTERFDLAQPNRRSVHVAGPKDLAQRERNHEREVTARQQAARDEQAARYF